MTMEQTISALSGGIFKISSIAQAVVNLTPIDQIFALFE